MTDEAAFTAALSADPTDATTRLVFADWLDEHARHVDAAVMRVLARPESDELRLAFADACEEEASRFLARQLPDHPAAGRIGYVDTIRRRAALARAQMELSGMLSPTGHVIGCHIGGCAPADPASRLRHPCKVCGRAWELRDRVTDVLVEGAKMGLPLAPEGMTYWLRGEPKSPPATFPINLVGLFERGFIERVAGPAADWLAHCEGILEQHPVKWLRLTTPLEFLITTQPNPHLAPCCAYTVRVSARGFMPGQILPDRCYLSSPATDVLVCDHVAGMISRADFDRALCDRFWPGIEVVPPVP